MVDNELLTAGFDLAVAEEDHGVKGHVAAVLAEEQQVPGPRANKVAANRKGVMPPQRLRVGELGEGSVMQDPSE